MTTQLKEPETDLNKKKREKAIAREISNLEKLKKQYAVQLKIKEDYVSTHLWEYYNPFRWQDEVSDLIRRKMIILAPAPNGIGKTTEMVCIASSWATGYEAWKEVDRDEAGAVQHNKKWYKSSSLGIKPPVRLRLTGEDWNHHLGQVVVPEMKKWFTMEDWHTKKNTSGIDYFWTHKNGSTIELMTHDQDVKLFEAWRGHGWLADEPPKYDIFKAMSRGLAENRGKMFFPSTPLKEAWMLDELIRKNRVDVGVMKDLTLFDNEISYDTDDQILTELGLTGKRTKHWRDADGQKKHFFDLILRSDLYIGDDGVKSGAPDDKGKSAEKYLRDNASADCLDIDTKIMQLIFLKRAKDTSLDEKPSRFFGLFKKLVGLVFKEFRRENHIIHDDGKGIPTNWPVAVFIDFHLSKPQAISVYAWDERNIQFVIKEVWENMAAEDIANMIIRWKKVECLRLEEVFIDPLSKGDEKYMKNRDAEAKDSFTIIEELLDPEGIELLVASKDKKSGIKNVKTALEGANGIPTLYFYDSLPSVREDGRGHVYEMERLCFDDKGGVKKEDDDFTENLYRSSLAGIKYISPASKHRGGGNDGGGSWMS